MAGNQSFPFRKLKGSVPFSVMARVAMQLGRESISNSITAIIELVKNAYDADAETVSIRFGGLRTENTILVIEDDGNGMTEEHLREQWMVIGTPNKFVTSKSTKKKRIFTGEKGLGRLGLDRLCERSIVQTFHEAADAGTEIVIDWEKYEEVNEKLEDIQHDLYEISKVLVDPIEGVESIVTKGTRIILYNLKDNWTESYLKTLRHELDLLVSPFSNIYDFKIILDTGLELDRIDGPVGSEYMLEAAEWVLKAEIDQDGNVNYKMSSPHHTEVFTLPKTAWHQRFQLTSQKKAECGPLTFFLYFFLRQNVELENLTYTKTQIDNFLEANQGIRIYRDGFRVKPYGEPDGSGDWLRLSYRRQQHPQGVVQKPLGGWKVGYNQVVGAVFIGREQNQALIDQTNREGIVEEQAFADLVRFAEDAIIFFEFNRQEFEMERKEADDYEKAKEAVHKKAQASTAAVNRLRNTTEKAISDLENAQDGGTKVDVVALRDALGTLIDDVDKTFIEAQEAQLELEKATEQREEELQRQKDTLGNLASLGILTATFGHETLGATNVVATNARQLKRNLERGLFMITPDVRDIVDDNLEFIVTHSERIETFARFALRNLSRDKRNRRKTYIDSVADQVFTFFHQTLKDKNITVEKDFREVSSILAFQIDWESIFINLITNSVWALQDTKDSDRKIRVTIFEENDYIHIKFADSGCGLATGTEDKVFVPTFSTRRNERGEQIGTGMGLSIVKDFVESYAGGFIEVESPCDLGGAQFHVRVKVPDLTSRGSK